MQIMNCKRQTKHSVGSFNLLIVRIQFININFDYFRHRSVALHILLSDSRYIFILFFCCRSHRIYHLQIRLSDFFHGKYFHFSARMKIEFVHFHILNAIQTEQTKQRRQQTTKNDLID